MSLVKKLTFKNLGDKRGDLVALEELKNIPFEIKRVYYLVNSTESRGYHAHRKLKQVLVALKGSCKISLDDGEKKESIILNSFTEGLVIDSLIWREMHEFSSDCVLVVLASEYYSEDDYIRDYEVFLKAVKNL